jgi:hypothetical protein
VQGVQGSFLFSSTSTPSTPSGVSSLLSPAIVNSQPSTLPTTPHPPPPQLPQQRVYDRGVFLTQPSAEFLAVLNRGEVASLQPLDPEFLEDVVCQLQAAARQHFGCELRHGVAISALEVSRHQQGSRGWPVVEDALGCLEVRSRFLQPSVVAPPPPPQLVSAVGQGGTFLRRAAGFVPQPPPLSQRVNSNLASSARYRNLLRSQETRVTCSSCGENGHQVLQCPHGLDVTSVVNSAQELGHLFQQRVLDLTATLPESAPDREAAVSGCNQAVREEAVLTISELSGVDPIDISSHLDELNGDPELTFVSAVCHVRGGPDKADLHDICSRELRRRRRQVQVVQASQAASSAPNSEAAYRSLASRVNLPAQLGFDYRMGGGLQLPPLPIAPVHTRRRRAGSDDLQGFVVDDHSSDPDTSSSSHRDNSPKRRRRRNSSKDSSGNDRDEEDHTSGSESNHSKADSDESVDDSDSSGGLDSDGSSGDDRNDKSDRNGKSSAVFRKDSEAPRGHTSTTGQRPDAPLTADSLAQILKALLDKRGRSDNNGLLASKTPSFWDLGKAPTGGYFAQTFTRVYGEFRQFRSVFGKNTGVSFKNLIMENMIPMVRSDLNLSRSDWKAISDRDLIRKLKRRLGFRERDAYIAELEACPRLSSSRDMTVLNSKFKELAAQMLSICERAQNHGVKLLRPSCKHVFSEAVKNCYRVNQWFRLRPFKSISDSVRHINSKLSSRLASAAEQRHEFAMDEAKMNGVRSQVGEGTSESSNAPSRFQKGKPKGGISKNGKDFSKDKSDRDKFSKKMDELYKAENELPKGRYWHMKTRFCDGDDCSCKFCQGCGQHQVKGRPWHDRPRCNQRSHPDFVASGYFHDKHPNRLCILSKNSDGKDQTPRHASNGDSSRDKTAARSNTLQHQPSAGDS